MVGQYVIYTNFAVIPRKMRLKKLSSTPHKYNCSCFRPRLYSDAEQRDATYSDAIDQFGRFSPTPYYAEETQKRKTPKPGMACVQATGFIGLATSRLHVFFAIQLFKRQEI